ncbi:MAG: DeoR/GlpR family DNA-binding transcription regulator [Clostridia bacterium]
MIKQKLKIDTRRNKIIEILNRDGIVKVSRLSEELKATPVTIRSDLDALEADGYLERVQGGAVQTAVNYYNREFIRRKRLNATIKKRIAAAAADLIHDGDTILINSGTTVYFTAVELKKRKNLRIVTNSLTAAIELGSVPSFHVILLGGEINSRDSFTYGSDVLEQLKRYRANYAILSIDGVCIDSGISTLHAEEVMVERMMMERANETIIIADSHKLEREGFLYVCDTEAIDKLVTDQFADPAVIKKLKQKNIKVLLG